MGTSQSLCCCFSRPQGNASPLPESIVVERLQVFASQAGTNLPELCSLPPKEFAERVIKGGHAVDSGDWVQPLYRKDVSGEWQLSKLEVIYRLKDAMRVPYPAFVDFVSASSDQCTEPDPDLRAAFRDHAVASLLRVDERLSDLRPEHRTAMEDAQLFIAVNFTAKQMSDILPLTLKNPNLICIEETEYDMEPASMSETRGHVWRKVASLSLDDVKLTLPDIRPFAEEAFEFRPPLTPAGAPYKPLVQSYIHDLAFARRFISDFKAVKRDVPTARSDLKVDEELCLYLIGIGHAPFSEKAMTVWREANPVASQAIRRAAIALLQEALAVGMDIVLEVTFQDSHIEWLLEELPALHGRLLKQGGGSGSAALPLSLAEEQLIAPMART